MRKQAVAAKEKNFDAMQWIVLSITLSYWFHLPYDAVRLTANFRKAILSKSVRFLWDSEQGHTSDSIHLWSHFNGKTDLRPIPRNVSAIFCSHVAWPTRPWQHSDKSLSLSARQQRHPEVKCACTDDVAKAGALILHRKTQNVHMNSMPQTPTHQSSDHSSTKNVPETKYDKFATVSDSWR